MPTSASQSAAPAGSHRWSAVLAAVLVVLSALLLAIAAAGRLLWHPWRQRGEAAPIETLKQRFALGEIGRDGNDRCRRALEGRS